MHQGLLWYISGRLLPTRVALSLASYLDSRNEGGFDSTALAVIKNAATPLVVASPLWKLLTRTFTDKSTNRGALHRFQPEGLSEGPSRLVR